jgi:hypothetical protein
VLKRWPIALRAAICTAVPVLLGWAAGDIGAGLIASIGAFTTRYGGDRPYANRAVLLSVIAVALSGAVALGDWAAQIPWLGVLTVSVVAVAAVWLCNALEVGPPGAYIFSVACAVGLGVSAAHLPSWRIGLLVLAGATFAWVVQMAGAVVDYRRPEQRAVIGAGEAVAAYLSAVGTTGERTARLRAATALHRAWRVLVQYQPVSPSPQSPLGRLRATNHAVHVAFADAMAHPEQVTGSDVDAVRHLVSTTSDEPPTVRDPERIPLGGPATATALRRALVRGSHTRHVMVRVAIAAPVAGLLAALLGYGHAYWAMAAAVLVLHQGADRVWTLRRGAERTVGTFLGLGLAGIILIVHPQGPLLALVLAVLLFGVEMLVQRNYTLAAVLITATALTIASGAHRVDVGDLLVDRGVDTLIGCVVALVVYLAAVRYQEATRVPAAIARTLDAVAITAAYLARADATSLDARTARRDLQIATIAMMESHEAAGVGNAAQRQSATRLWPVVVSAEYLAYQVISACWELQHHPGQSYPVRYAHWSDRAAALRGQITG